MTFDKQSNGRRTAVESTSNLSCNRRPVGPTVRACVRSCVVNQMRIGRRDDKVAVHTGHAHSINEMLTDDRRFSVPYTAAAVQIL